MGSPARRVTFSPLHPSGWPSSSMASSTSIRERVIPPPTSTAADIHEAPASAESGPERRHSPFSGFVREASDEAKLAGAVEALAPTRETTPARTMPAPVMRTKGIADCGLSMNTVFGGDTVSTGASSTARRWSRVFRGAGRPHGGRRFFPSPTPDAGGKTKGAPDLPSARILKPQGTAKPIPSVDPYEPPTVPSVRSVSSVR